MSSKRKDLLGDHPTPDSTTKEKQSFLIGDEVLMQRKDGNFYLGTVVKIDLSRDQCLVKFGDNTDSWSVFSRLTKLSTGLDVMCVKCKVSESKTDNDIIVCDRCSRGYHQLCHVPQVKNDELKDDSKWECSRCQELPGKRQLPPRKSTQALPVPRSLSPSVPPQTTVSPVNTVSEPQKKKLPYNLSDLHWDMQHRVNTEGKYCYCGNSGKWFLQMLQCGRCRQWFHGRCISSLKTPLFYGDRFYVFICLLCNSGKEYLRRLELKWVDLVHLTIFNLTLKTAKKYQDVDLDIINFINTEWSNLQLPPKIIETDVAERRETVMSVLTSNRNRFKYGREVKKRTTMWGLKVRVPPPTPVFSLPPNKPLTDQVLSDAWNNSARLKFLPGKLLDSEIVKDYNLYPDWEKLKDTLPGLELLHVDTRLLVLPNGVPANGHNVCIKSSTPCYPESRSQIERRLKAQVADDRLRSFKSKKSKKRNLEKNSKEQELPPTPPSSESNPDVNLTTQPDTSGDESSSRGTLDSIIPPPADFEGRNNPFLSTSLPVNLVPVLRPTKRRLSEKDIIITSNGEIKRRRVRRVGKLGARGIHLENGRRMRRIKSAQTTPTTSPVKSQSSLNMEDLKSTVNLYFGGVNRIAAGEKFSVRAKRILPDGRTQYLINWGCSPT
ncbi:PHD finger protein 19 [Cimex lectularius]|uniref:PHD-type domain-containing protein n=1 Tax=Cimex lectularius TaxID=79782 RepID=A0A8I6R6F1_CIMLE|nr:PHD finger protein 19 [Cimex lectularius]